MSIAVYGCQALTGMNKAGKLLDVGNGYREITLGAFNIDNAQGERYSFTERLKMMFEPGGDLRRRIDSQQVRSEVDHPRFEPGMSKMQFLHRVRTIRLDRVCSHIRKVRLQAAKDHMGKDIILTIGEVRPSGVMVAALDTAMDNPDENVAYSVRSLTAPTWINGKKHKEITTLVTWDFVPEPGIHLANKYDTPSMESLGQEEITFNEFEFEQAAAMADSANLGFEGNEAVSMTYIREAFGWNKIELITPRASALW